MKESILAISFLVSVTTGSAPAALVFPTGSPENVAPNQILLVFPDGTGPYPTIQAAVSAASSGDIVRLANGVFTGPGNRNIILWPLRWPRIRLQIHGTRSAGRARLRTGTVLKRSQ